jgi:TonB family protein
MKITELLAEDITRRGFLQGAISSLALLPSIVNANDREKTLQFITSIAGTIWDFRKSGYSRSATITALEEKMGIRGEALRVAGLICDFAWSQERTYYTRNEFIQIVRQQALSNLPGSTSSNRPVKKHNDEKTAVSPSYEGRVKNRILPNIVRDPMSTRLAEEGSVTVEIRIDSSGDILGSKIIKSSGFSRLDNAVIRGIEKTEILPKDTNGIVPKLITITFNIGENQIDETSQEAIQKIDDITR